MIRLSLPLLVLCLALPTTAQDEAVEDRLAELERKNTELEERLAEIEAAQEEQYLEEDDGLGLQIQYADVGATLQVFGDVGFEYLNPEPADEGHTSFFLGSVDFMINMSFGDHWRALSETVIDGKSDDDIELSQERLWGAWIPEDWFYVKFGTEHSPISRWNQLYHHGHWLETSIRRPLLAAFEGGMGVLPLHRTGVTLGGNAIGDSGRFEYFGTVSNGRGEQPDDKQRTEDADDHKAIDVGIAFEPFTEAEWRFGVAAVRDTIPRDPGSTNPARTSSMDEWIYTAHVEWRSGPFYALGEYAFIDHESDETNRDYDSNVSYVQVEYSRGEWTPYTRVDYRNMDEGDPYYADLLRDRDLWLATLGLRVDVASNVALKFESSYGQEDVPRGSGGTDDRSVVFFAVQLAWWL